MLGKFDIWLDFDFGGVREVVVFLELSGRDAVGRDGVDLLLGKGQWQRLIDELVDNLESQFVSRNASGERGGELCPYGIPGCELSERRA